MRQPEKAAELAAVGIDVRTADYQDRESLVRAFTDADKVLLVSTGGADVVTEHLNAVQAATEARVPHIVYLSGIQAGSSYVGDVHRQTEEAIKATGATYTMLRNNMYADVLVLEVLAGAKTGELSAPVGEGRVTAVTRGDCAAVAAAVLAGPVHENATYDITGAESIGWSDLAEIASEATGRIIPFTPASSKATADGLNTVMMDYYRGIAAGGYDVSSTAVARLTGRPATPTKAYILEAVREALAGAATGRQASTAS